jgi:hypothetical protein
VEPVGLVQVFIRSNVVRAAVSDVRRGYRIKTISLYLHKVTMDKARG